eukprot:CAMPEP_0172542566 /NCGR_PEP_ID=MMETSP1067-20121228/13149_1 /TAXON_ID=265564 ORGANISM="Thalassiosira punctigera, Strain Tpunct2005C2" /NCGR_SAMPLE_ID=MMETSP1067 /ASSEMBLY_ACC=CAM_ASM_000444 /LENGTH=171 /DNA_ID=CAMNT_0013328835 /DNA_START=136 /DNA_END=649 /DNA_ORIENTATION=+
MTNTRLLTTCTNRPGCRGRGQERRRAVDAAVKDGGRTATLRDGVFIVVWRWRNVILVANARVHDIRWAKSGPSGGDGDEQREVPDGIGEERAPRGGGAQRGIAAVRLVLFAEVATEDERSKVPQTRDDGFSSRHSHSASPCGLIVESTSEESTPPSSSAQPEGRVGRERRR